MLATRAVGPWQRPRLQWQWLFVDDAFSAQSGERNVTFVLSNMAETRHKLAIKNGDITMNKLLAVSTLAALAANAPALAADPVRPIPGAPVAPIVDTSSIWDGFYAGVNVGYGSGVGTASDANGWFSDQAEGWLGGAQLGHNIVVDGLVLGLEGDYQLSDINWHDDILGANMEVSINHFGTARVRLGADMGTVMPYLTAGLAFGELGTKLTAGAASINASGYALGWAAGGGIEAMVSDNVSLKGEYLFASLGSIDIDGMDVEANAHSARFGLNFHF